MFTSVCVCVCDLPPSTTRITKSHLSLQSTCESIIWYSILRKVRMYQILSWKSKTCGGLFFSPSFAPLTSYLLKGNMMKQLIWWTLSYLEETVHPSYFVGPISDKISKEVIRWKDVIGPIFFPVSHSAKPLLAKSLRTFWEPTRGRRGDSWERD